MPFGVKRLVRLGDEGRRPSAPRGLNTGVLKIRDGLDELLVAGAHGGGVQGKNMIEDAHEHLQPFGLAARCSFSTSSRSVAFSLSFIFNMNSENRRTSSAILSAIVRAAAVVFQLPPRRFPG